jgi:hypothetical protein
VTIDDALFVIRRAIRTGDFPQVDEDRSMRTLVRDCLLRLCGRIIAADSSISRSELSEYLQDESGRGEVLLGSMALELFALRVAAPEPGGSINREAIRIVCEAHSLQTVERQTIRAFADDAHREKCAGTRPHESPDSEVTLDRRLEEAAVVGTIGVAPEGGIGTSTHPEDATKRLAAA